MLWRRTSRPRCSRSGVNARRRPAWATSSSWSRDASSLDFPHASFDAAVSRWGIIFEPDAEATAGRIRGFLKRGEERLNVPPAAAGTPGPPPGPPREGRKEDSPEHFTAYIRAISAPIRGIEQHAGEAQEEAWDAITQAAADAGVQRGRNRLAPASHNSRGGPRRAGRTGRLR